VLWNGEEFATARVCIRRHREASRPSFSPSASANTCGSIHQAVMTHSSSQSWRICLNRLVNALERLCRKNRAFQAGVVPAHGLAAEAAENERNVLAAEAKTVAEGVVAALRPGLVSDVVEVAIGVGILVVDRRRQNVVADGEKPTDHSS